MSLSTFLLQILTQLLVLGRLLVWSSIRSSRHARPTVDHGKEWSTENEYNALALVCLKPEIVHNPSNLPRRQPNPWLPIYRIMYNKMKINLPLCCLSTQRFDVVNNMANCALRMYLFYYFRGTGAAPELSRHGRPWSSIGRQLLPITRPWYFQRFRALPTTPTLEK